MRQRFSTANPGTLRRLVYAAAVLGALTLPVSYRGGADVAHPHAVFQLWADGADGSADHHHRREERAGASHEARDAERRPATTGAPSPPDVPRRTEVTPAHERPLIVPALALLGLVLLLTHVTPVWGVAVPLLGRRLRPDVPPPRLLVAA